MFKNTIYRYTPPPSTKYALSSCALLHLCVENYPTQGQVVNLQCCVGNYETQAKEGEDKRRELGTFSHGR